MSDLVVVGIDADARRVAYATVRDGNVSAVSTIVRSNQMARIEADYDQRLTAFFRRASEMGSVVYLEGIWLADKSEANVQAFRSLAMVQGELAAAARRVGVVVNVVQPGEWRAVVMPKVRGRAECKKAAGDIAGRAVGREDLSEHEADAVCIALAGWTWECETERDK